MANWKIYKGLKPNSWKFIPQSNKLNYNDAVRIVSYNSVVWDMTNKDFGDTPITAHTHDPGCGYWFKVTTI